MMPMPTRTEMKDPEENVRVVLVASVRLAENNFERQLIRGNEAMSQICERYRKFA
jgi:hypothetical protein